MPEQFDTPPAALAHSDQVQRCKFRALVGKEGNLCRAPLKQLP